MVDFNRLVVYIGSGWCIPGSKNGPKLQDSTNYICIDTPKSNLWSSVGQSIYDRLSIPIKKKVQLHRANGKNTGLEDNSADEVHIHNVLGDKGIKDREGIFLEAGRIVKDNGAIFVGETISPYPLRTLVRLAEKNRMSWQILIDGKETEIYAGQKEVFYNMIGEYYRSSDQEKSFIFSKDSYLIKFT